ncbi:unnamed protein product [Effrenium voratum]|uniref:Pentatricopeptide repeat-containing protein n=1 Tax=Effrenium voratum TaxID=2562239 RepID=A0AA36J9Y0_9DINO|nr:unnamed protein product [Effrenium voratum]
MTSDWARALALVRQFHLRSLELDVFSLSAATCALAGRWSLAVAFFTQMLQKGLEANVVSTNSLILGPWRRALSLALGGGDLVAGNAGMALCRRRWRLVLALEAQLGAGGLRRDVVTWGAKGAALESAGQWRRAFEAEGCV